MEEVLNRYQTTLKPMHQQFIEPTKASFADIIIPKRQIQYRCYRRSSRCNQPTFDILYTFPQ
jgi:uridine kinase